MTTPIWQVIGWKFDNQPGMTTVDGVITEFPGGIPSQAEQDAWTAEYEAWRAAQDIKDEALMRLAQLDLKVPRGLEDLIASQGIVITTLPQVTQDILAEKVLLRGKL